MSYFFAIESHPVDLRLRGDGHARPITSEPKRSIVSIAPELLRGSPMSFPNGRPGGDGVSHGINVLPK